ncbi:hypothetical protein BKA66DRAFT_434763 [Pyrenochaeta sp. MPI-SDFR-AT-0127]|nr:hypothetical protein BKA66DRAFT_434763 [Pyrenochaeta sp. MPI-SDFR-AT-0127]
MADSVTEIVYLPLKEGTDLESGDAKSAWQDTLKTIASQDGLESLFWGRQIESKDTVQMLVKWDHIDSHTVFTKKPEYQPFLEKLGTILGGPPFLFHVKLPAGGAADANPFTAPVTECVSAYFDPSQSEEEYNTNFNNFRSEAAKIPNVEAIGLEGGWSVETHQHENLGEGVDGKLFAAFIGWPTVDSHMAFRKTEDFGKIIGHLRGGTKGIKMWHVAFTQYK